MVASGVGPGEHGEKTGIWIINVLAATPRQIRGDAEGAVPSPDGSLIAFRNSTGTSNLSVVDPSGEHVRVLATTSVIESFGKLQWSPDGKQIAALVRYVGDPAASIVAFALADGKRTVLTRHEHIRTFVWLPDGRFIIALQPSETSGSLLYDVYADGKKHQLDVDAGVAIADISATADGKRLAIVRTSQQSDVYVASFRGSALTEPVRVTLDERDDRPTGWSPDSKTILFESKRNDTLDVFRQRLDSPAGEQIAAGPDEQYGAEVTPDGTSILYLSTSGNAQPVRLLALPIGGGAATPVLEAPPGSQFHCPAPGRPKVSRCVLLTPVNGGLHLELFDWRNGQREPLPQVPFSPVSGVTLFWALSCDAARIAFPDSAGLHVVELRDGRLSTLPPTTFPGGLAGVALPCGSQELLVTTSATRQNVLFSVRDSRLQALWSSPRPISSPIVSPDGQHLLLGITATSSNAWLLEDF